MNILIDELPRSVTIDGEEYPVNWGFRTFVLIEICIFDQKISDEDRIASALGLFYGDYLPQNFTQAFEKMMWFYQGGKTEKQSTAKGASPKRCYCFDQDAPFIYSAFRTQYRIDLQDIQSEDLHWWKFKSLFESLNEDLKISKIMSYRAINTAGMGKEQKQYYAAMKKQYALDVEINAGGKMALAKRDADMRSRIQKRMNEAAGGNSIG